MVSSLLSQRVWHKLPASLPDSPYRGTGTPKPLRPAGQTRRRSITPRPPPGTSSDVLPSTGDFRSHNTYQHHYRTSIPSIPLQHLHKTSPIQQPVLLDQRSGGGLGPPGGWEVGAGRSAVRFTACAASGRKEGPAERERTRGICGPRKGSKGWGCWRWMGDG
jgi:hypothetical protein